MSATGSWLTQKGIVAALKANLPLMALIKGVFDQVKEGQLYPYIVVGEGSETEDLTMGQGGHAVRAELEIWTQDGANTAATSGTAGYKSGLAIAELVVTTLQASAFTVDDHDVVDVRLEDVGRERVDANTRVVTPRLLILLEDAA